MGDFGNAFNSESVVRWRSVGGNKSRMAEYSSGGSVSKEADMRDRQCEEISYHQVVWEIRQVGTIFQVQLLVVRLEVEFEGDFQSFKLQVWRLKRVGLGPDGGYTKTRCHF